MTEEEARQWVRERFGVPRETMLQRFAALLAAENKRQNLIAASTIPVIWGRHLVDSAQLLPLARDAGEGVWVDVGSGPGLPGMVIALLDETRPVVLVEPRARRIDFLRQAAEELGLSSRVTLVADKVERWQPARPAAVISARAVAALPSLFHSTAHCTDSSTVWVLPKGRNAQSEVAEARRAWQGAFHVEPSITDADSGIVVAQGVRAR
ncbi:16S rRNA (guanine(527)-N(7))-methyltransferase RsmG [Sphingomonas canadensis]|uniref:Ribosomal RNA small subunit methyltransferase G n=1 Tax=Sphingomonas canadensis TaxID=1219257 RepID=A0ABW3H7C9_9SPHN|nr:16S rRNA (guanine(527)-N(7))-methyltransferase RsmG [Sphingomonas canadensis]MCW3834901.1 16S rRNA (guanine(527)-N(7))-methyltransferase RsmG [Sphingomonas canadensis]